MSRPWYRELTPYHWLVFIVASAAWFFDCMDQRLFSLARTPALESLLGNSDPGAVQAAGKQVTAAFLVGWGIGGIIFGSLGDRLGRARMLTTTVLIYSVCTGLTYFSRGFWDFAISRFLTGLGIGGVFGLAVSLIAETVSPTARAGALGMLQVLSTIGNIAAGFTKMGIDKLEQTGTITAGNGWRWMFVVGALPALLVVLTRKYLHEPEPWLKLRDEGKLPTGSILQPYFSLWADARWRRNLIVGAVLATTGVVGLWGIGEYAVDLQKNIFAAHFTEQGLTPVQVKAEVGWAISWAYIFQMLGAAVGMWLFTKLAVRLGPPDRVCGGVHRVFAGDIGRVLQNGNADRCVLDDAADGRAQLAVFAGFAIYLPELFPSRLRSSGTSFCYNLGRFAAAAGSLFSAQLATGLYGEFGSPLKERYAAMTMCVVFLAGLAILPFAPETKDQPLPE